MAQQSLCATGIICSLAATHRLIDRHIQKWKSSTHDRDVEGAAAIFFRRRKDVASTWKNHEIVNVQPMDPDTNVCTLIIGTSDNSAVARAGE